MTHALLLLAWRNECGDVGLLAHQLRPFNLQLDRAEPFAERIANRVGLRWAALASANSLNGLPQDDPRLLGVALVDRENFRHVGLPR